MVAMRRGRRDGGAEREERENRHPQRRQQDRIYQENEGDEYLGDEGQRYRQLVVLLRPLQLPLLMAVLL